MKWDIMWPHFFLYIKNKILYCWARAPLKKQICCSHSTWQSWLAECLRLWLHAHVWIRQMRHDLCHSGALQYNCGDNTCTKVTALQGIAWGVKCYRNLDKGRLPIGCHRHLHGKDEVEHCFTLIIVITISNKIWRITVT